MIHDENIDRLERSISFIDFSDIDDEFINEVTGINLGEKLNKCKICVYGNEGAIPHFHIISNDNSFETCICIFEPLYFNHGSKQGRLTRKQRIRLNEWLSTPHKGLEPYTEWQVFKDLWKSFGNPLKNWKENSKQPNYTDMENMKG